MQQQQSQREKFDDANLKILQVKQRIVWWKYFPTAKQSFRDWRSLLKEAAREPTTAKELVMGDPEFLVWVDASEEAVGGVWLPRKDSLEPTIWRLEWPNKLRARMITPTNPGGGLGYKKYRNDRKSSGMARVGRNIWHQKPPL